MRKYNIRKWRRSGVFIKFEHILHLVLVFNFGEKITGWIPHMIDRRTH